MIRKSIYAPRQQPNIQLPQSIPQNNPSQIRNKPQQRIIYPNQTIDQYLNTRRITKDRLCLALFVLYVLGLVIMMGIGLFSGNYEDIGYFVNAKAQQKQQENCNAKDKYLDRTMTTCTVGCPSGFAYLGKVCLSSRTELYNPSFTTTVDGLISMYGIKYTFPKIIYVSAGLLIVTAILFTLVIYFPKIIYIFTAVLFFMLLGMAFYLLKNFETRVSDNNIQPGTIFYTNQQSTRFISFFFLGLYLLIFPFVLFSPKKIQLGTFLISKLYQFYRTMSNTIIFSFFIIVLAWGSVIVQIFVVMNLYSAGTIVTTPVFSMFHTYKDMNMSHPASLTFHFIGVFWFFSALISWHKYFISSSMCLWYFQDSQSLYPIKRGLKRSLHHVGSAALDGILVPIQWLFMLLYSVFKISDDKDNQDDDDVNSCLSSCFNAFSGFIISLYSSINRNSPCSASLTNQDYFSSCQHSAQIFSINKHRFFNIGGTLTIFLTLFICILWVVIMYFIVYFTDYNTQYPPAISSVVLPVFCVFVVGLVVGSLFTNIFSASVDCLLFCYLVERKSLDAGDQSGMEIQRKEDQLKIKIILDQYYYKSKEQAKTSVFIYEERDDNTLDVTYLAKKQ